MRVVAKSTHTRIKGGAIQFAVYEQVSAWLEKNKRTQ